MAKNQKQEKQIKDESEAEILEEAAREIPGASERVAEKGKLTEDEIVYRKIRQELEDMDLGDTLKLQAQGQAGSMQSLEEKEKLKQLLKIAKKKGVAYAVHVAKKMNDPYVLDMFHDMLVNQGYYKKFIK